MGRKLFIMMVVVTLSVTPTNAQSLLQQFKQLKESVGIKSKKKESKESTDKVGDKNKNDGKNKGNANDTEIKNTPPAEIFIPVKPLPLTEDGWTLVHTNSHDFSNYSIKYDHYESETRAVRVLTVQNGDFITLEEDENSNYNEINIKRYSRAIGPYRVTCEDGSILEGVGKAPDNDYIRYHFLNGTILWGTSVFGLSYDRFIDLIEHKKDTKADWLKRGSGKEFVYESRNLNVILPDDTTCYYAFDEYDHDTRLFTKGDRKYTLDEGGWPEPVLQKFGERFYYISDTDTIVNVQKRVPFSWGEQEMYVDVISYANGDEIKIQSQGPRDDPKYYSARIMSGTIHRNGGVLKLSWINGKKRFRLTMPNGDFFTGSFKEQTCDDEREEYSHLLQNRELTPYNGVWNRGGITEEYEKGMSKAERERAQKEKEKREAAANKAEYDKECREYGKTYVDAARDREIIIGMPEKLFLSTFKATKSSQSRYSTVYNIYYLGEKTGTVTISQGRVSRVRRW